MVHAVDGAVQTGDRVHAHWRDETVGAITDIVCFLPGDGPEQVPDPTDDPVDSCAIVLVLPLPAPCIGVATIREKELLLIDANV